MVANLGWVMQRKPPYPTKGSVGVEVCVCCCRLGFNLAPAFHHGGQTIKWAELIILGDDFRLRSWPVRSVLLLKTVCRSSSNRRSRQQKDKVFVWPGERAYPHCLPIFPSAWAVWSWRPLQRWANLCSNDGEKHPKRVTNGKHKNTLGKKRPLGRKYISG